MTLQELHAAYTSQGDKIAKMETDLAAARKVADDATASAKTAEDAATKAKADAESAKSDASAAKTELAGLKESAATKADVKASEDRIAVSLGALGIRSDAKPDDKGEVDKGDDKGEPKTMKAIWAANLSK